MAGLKIAVGSGTNQEKILLEWDKQNQAEGLKPVDVQYYQNDSDTTLALQSGRIDLSFGPNATAAYKAAIGMLICLDRNSAIQVATNNTKSAISVSINRYALRVALRFWVSLSNA